jgi:acyl dehydratase
VKPDLASMPGLPALYTRAVLQAARAATWSRTGRGIGSDGLAAEPLRLSAVPLAPGLPEYREVCGFAGNDTVPGSYPQALAFPLQLAVLTAPGFPFPAVGAVHVANTVVQEAALSSDDVLDLAVFATDLRPHRRGRQVTLVTEARTGDQVVWRARSDFLHRERPADTGRPSQPAAGSGSVPGWPAGDGGDDCVATARWQLPAGLGRRYAAVSGDRNPIHLYDATAWPFGFRRHIAHGMWLVARCLAQLEAGLPDTYRCEVVFRHPVELPGEVEFVSRVDSGRTDFEVRSVTAALTHLSGSVVGG